MRMPYSQRWIEILNEVKDFSSGKPVVWFRGHGKHDSFKLKSGLFREELPYMEDYLNSELQKYQEFLYLGHLDHKDTDWNLLYLMQHYGVKTRLLDWSESFVTALFFAYINWSVKDGEENACVWMFNPTYLNELTRESTGLYLPFDDHYENYLEFRPSFSNNSVALFPVRNTKRIVAQQGVFTLQGNTILSLDQEHDGLLLDEDLIKIMLTKDLYSDVQCYLRHAGVSHYTLFPDLEGLAKYVNSPFLDSPNGLRIPKID